MINEKLRNLELEISDLIYNYNEDKEQFKNKFENFIINKYYISLEKLNDLKSLNKEDIIFYTKIKQTFEIFNSLLSFDDDFPYIYQIISKNENYKKFILILFNYGRINFEKLCKIFNYNEKEMIKIMDGFTDFGLYSKEYYYEKDKEFIIFNITNKGIRFVKKPKKPNISK